MNFNKGVKLIESVLRDVGFVGRDYAKPGSNYFIVIDQGSFDPRSGSVSPWEGGSRLFYNAYNYYQQKATKEKIPRSAIVRGVIASETVKKSTILINKFSDIVKRLRATTNGLTEKDPDTVSLIRKFVSFATDQSDSVFGKKIQEEKKGQTLGTFATVSDNQDYIKKELLKARLNFDKLVDWRDNKTSKDATSNSLNAPDSGLLDSIIRRNVAIIGSTLAGAASTIASVFYSTDEKGQQYISDIIEKLDLTKKITEENTLETGKKFTEIDKLIDEITSWGETGTIGLKDDEEEIESDPLSDDEARNDYDPELLGKEPEKPDTPEEIDQKEFEKLRKELFEKDLWSDDENLYDLAMMEQNINTKVNQFNYRHGLTKPDERDTVVGYSKEFLYYFKNIQFTGSIKDSN